MGVLPTIAWIVLMGIATQQPARSQAEPYVGPVSPWPRPIPARVQPKGRDDLFVMTLGEVQTPLADGTYDPVADRVTLRDGRVIDDYYKHELGIEQYQPIDKSVFRVPPSGWCSWYYYYQEITPEEVLANARWIADNLADYGARYVQIDDGWQGTGHGAGDNRDWSTIDARFRELGMDGLAREIRALGLEAGLWLAPHGQSNEQLARKTNAFLFKPDGTSASSTWEGTYLVDPSTEAGGDYLRDLFERLHGWGYTYFKIDGQPIVIDEFKARQEFMHGPAPDKPSDERAIGLYRDTLKTIRGAIGNDSYLLGCWGIPLPGVGIMNGSRTAGDVAQGWGGFLVARDAVVKWNYLHNIAWYCDPDVCMVRPPLTDNIARCWATIEGMTGQALLTSDRLPDLPASRVEMLRRIYPAVDIRPLDLYSPDDPAKPIWLLKVAEPAKRPEIAGLRLPDWSFKPRHYDVAAVFNVDHTKSRTLLLSWAALGLDATKRYHVYDYWRGVYLGCWEAGVFVDVPPHDVRVITLVPAESRPVLVSTNRHITQGWVDVVGVESAGSADRPLLRGVSRVISGDPYTLTVGIPPKTGYRISSVDVRALTDAAPRPDLREWHRSHQGYVTVTVDSPRTRFVSWEIEFEPAELYTFPVRPPHSLRVSSGGLTGATVQWDEGYEPKAGYRVELDGEPLGVAFGSGASLANLGPGHEYKVAVRSVWFDGAISEQAAETQYTVEVPGSLDLATLDPVVQQQGWGTFGRNRSCEGNPLRVAGVTYERGIGTHAKSKIVYELGGAFTRFVAKVGLDDEANAPEPVEAVFEVFGDGQKLWSSEPIHSHQAAVLVDLEIKGVDRLELRVGDGGDGIDYDHADWLNVHVVR